MNGIFYAFVLRPAKEMMEPEDFLKPLIPQQSLFWNGLPLFHVNEVPDSFSGSLYFVLGQGLGDHVNGLRILCEIKSRFPQANCLVYADRRWEELVTRMSGVGVRWYPRALDPRSAVGTNNPYALAHGEIKREIQGNIGQAFLAYDHFPMPDRHARGETTLEAISRAIGLDLGDHARPFLPLVDLDNIWAENFLKGQGLEEGKFAVLAPFSWPNKMWPRERFSFLIDTLREKYGLRSVLVAYPEVGPFNNVGAVMAYDLTIGQIGGLLACSGLYVGLDSGPSHMAAALDLPMVVIFTERNTIPFEVRAMTPWALHVVEGFEKKIRDPSLVTVEEAVAFIWAHKNNLPDKIPRCPACLRTAHYVIGAKEGMLDFMCACGLKITDNTFLEESLPLSQTNLSLGESISRNLRDEETHNTLIRRYSISSLCSLSSFKEAEKDLGTHPYETVEIIIDTRMETLKGFGQSSDLPFRSKIEWAQDALILWIARLGYLLHAVEIRDDLHSVWVFSGAEKNKNLKTLRSSRVTIPWSGRFLKLSSAEDYVRWYSFEKWGHPSDLVGVVKSLVSLGYHREACSVAWVTFRMDPSVRSFRWLLKTSYFFLFGQ